jgi:hypothetical protein
MVDLRLAVKRANGTAPLPQWPEPDMRLIEDDRPPAPVLEDDALPRGWGEYITAEAAARGCPPDYVAAALICCASACIGNSRHVGATPTWTEPPNLWFAQIGAPSTGKTHALRPFIDACRAIQREAEPDWAAEKAEHAAQVEDARALQEGWRDAARAAAKSGQVAPPVHAAPTSHQHPRARE